jgi:transposase InsO family protein
VPWRETSPVDERMRFMARLRDGERMGDLCAEFGISRKTGQKLKARFEHAGVEGLKDQSRAPRQIPHRTTREIQELILETKRAHMSWGPKKLRAWLQTKNPGVELPSSVTFGYWLAKAGLVERRGKRRRAPTSEGKLKKPESPNQVWATDFKGQFRLGNGNYCYPLTITDVYSRYLLAVVALDSTKVGPAVEAFGEVFREFGVPEVIRSDNGCPFASAGLYGLSRLSAYWLRLGARPERIEPGHPEQNGQHERMHLTLKQETTRPAAKNLLQQQERFDDFREQFNSERPHEALGQRPPASVYRPSPRKAPTELAALDYPLHDLQRTVARHGVIALNGGYYFLSHALAGEQVGLREEDPGRWSVSFMDLRLGCVDESTRKFTREASA